MLSEGDTEISSIRVKISPALCTQTVTKYHSLGFGDKESRLYTTTANKRQNCQLFYEKRDNMAHQNGYSGLLSFLSNNSRGQGEL